MQILVISGNPRKDSFTYALAKAYVQGALKAGMTVKLVSLSDLEFIPDVIHKHPQHQRIENDLQFMQDEIRQADHLVFVYPTWWGSTPALLKAFFDRTFTPGFAFRELNYGNYDKKLKGKTAQIITTMDTPPFLYKFFHMAPGTRALRISTLNFCGISPVKTKIFSPVNYAEPKKLGHWLEETENMGYALRFGFLSGKDKFFLKAEPWIKLMRLQFYPLTMITFLTGIELSTETPENIWIKALIAYIILFLTETATVFTNELADLKTDMENKNFGPFSGGSRVLVNKELSSDVVKKVRNYLLGGVVLLTAVLFFLLTKNQWSILFLIIFSAFAGLAYSLKPFRLSYRGMGALTVGFTHGIAPLWLGRGIAGGDLSDPVIIALGLLLSLSILPGIILSGIPDYISDKISGKKTEAVILGIKNIYFAAILISATTFLTAVFLSHNMLSDLFYGWIYLMLPLTVYFLYLLLKKIQQPVLSARIDTIMIFALLFMFILSLIPFLNSVF